MSSRESTLSDGPEICFGTPTPAEIKRYFAKHASPAVCSPDITDESSFELDESFQNMIDRKRKEMIEAKLNEITAEELSPNSPVPELSADSHASNAGDSAYTYCGNDSTLLEQDSMHKITDESFEEMERMCSINQSKVGTSFQVEEESYIQKILDNYSKKIGETVSQKNAMSPSSAAPSRNDKSMAFGDVTQIDDVEEPSCLWENTILPVGKIISPVKRMHMLRPSTIIEEATINETASIVASKENTSLESYETAKQNCNNSDYSIITGSEVYRTADEGDQSKASTVNSTHDSAIGFDSTANKTSVELGSSKNVNLNVPDEDVVIILSSSDSEADESSYIADESLIETTNKLDTCSIFETSDSLQENSLCQDERNVPSSPLPKTIVNNLKEFQDEYEVPGSPLLDEIPDKFNDTLEEMEFMMRQGMKVMQQQKAQEQQRKEKAQQMESVSSTKKCIPSLIPINPASPYATPKQPNSSNSKNNLFQHSGSKINSAQKSNSVPSSSVATFKKPTSRFPLPKSAKKYDHIVSPISAYINKTPQTALQARIFNPHHNLSDVLYNKRDNRDSVMSSKENFVQPEVDPNTYCSSLPRKGVISSRGAHVLDERNAVRIPGGEKIHKLLNNSPTMVIRHEGRLKYQRDTQLTDDSVADDSIADLSMASGDVSVRVLKDVRRF